MVGLLIVVTARGGSKRLPGKNIRPLAGRSLIARTADAIADSGLAGPVLLTTDDKDIAAEGQRNGMQVPFLRPAQLATDTATTADTVLHALDWYRNHSGTDPDTVMVLQPTSPLRGGKCLQDSVAMLSARPQANSVVAVTALDLPSTSLFLTDAEDFLQPLSTDMRHPLYAPNGAVYLTRTAALRRESSVYAMPMLPLIMDPQRSIDINTAADWSLATAILTSGILSDSPKAAPPRQETDPR